MDSVKVSLDKLSEFDFNIFELNDLIDTRTIEFMSFEIFNKYEFFEELIDESKYRNFIKEITTGYSRNISYHNDLHAGDVMQTVYVMIEKGELIKVSLKIYFRNFI